MKSANWKYFAELTGIAAIAASLIFVGLQMRQTQELAYAQASVDLMANHIAKASLKAEYADVWAKGNSGDQLSGRETYIYRELIALEDTSAFLEYSTYGRLGSYGNEISAIDFATLLHRNSGARREWDRRQAEFRKYREPLLSVQMRGHRWVDEVVRYLDELDTRYSDQ